MCLYIVFAYDLVMGNEEKGLANNCATTDWNTRAIPLSLNFSEQLHTRDVLFTCYKEHSMKC